MNTGVDVFGVTLGDAAVGPKRLIWPPLLLGNLSEGINCWNETFLQLEGVSIFNTPP